MNWIDISQLILISIPIVSTFVLGIYLVAKKQSALGTPSINTFFFYSGKFSMFFLWALFGFICVFPEYRNYVPFLLQDYTPEVQKLLSAIFLLPASMLLIPAYISMGKYTRVGLPTTRHSLTTTGVYKISRNPMYASFLFLNTATFLFIPSVVVLAMVVYGTFIHHRIILAEEKFLEKEFGTAFIEYKKDSPRYL